MNLSIRIQIWTPEVLVIIMMPRTIGVTTKAAIRYDWHYIIVAYNKQILYHVNQAFMVELLQKGHF